MSKNLSNRRFKIVVLLAKTLPYVAMMLWLVSIAAVCVVVWAAARYLFGW